VEVYNRNISINYNRGRKHQQLQWGIETIETSETKPANQTNKVINQTDLVARFLSLFSFL
jgi:hypothetical protein